MCRATEHFLEKWIPVFRRNRGYAGMMMDAGDIYGNGASRGRYRVVSLTYQPDGLTAR